MALVSIITEQKHEASHFEGKWRSDLKNYLHNGMKIEIWLTDFSLMQNFNPFTYSQTEVGHFEHDQPRNYYAIHYIRF